jgi:hypothetical protein
MPTYSVNVNNGRLDSIETTVGTLPIVRLYNGTMPANARTALSGNTVLAQGSAPSDWLSAAASDAKAINGTWSLTGQAGAGAGTAATFYRIFNSGDTIAHIQGRVGGPSFTLTTSALTAANGNVLTFASTTGVAVGMDVSGTGILPGAKVIAFTGTTVTLSLSSTAGVANTTVITFRNEMTLDNNSIANAQAVSVTGFTINSSNINEF